MVETTSLENWYTRKGIEGSNPSLSATFLKTPFTELNTSFADFSVKPSLFQHTLEPVA